MTITRFARFGMVCSIDHLASAAGLAMLDRGGSAVDAAIATNAVLAVTAPHACGLGGDLFALVHGLATLELRGLLGDPDTARASWVDAITAAVTGYQRSPDADRPREPAI